MPLLRVALMALSLLSLGIVASGCKSGDEAPAATAVETAVATELSPDIQDVNAVIDAVLSRDPQRVAPLISYTSIPCRVPPRLPGGPPECATTETDGAPVEVLPADQCEGFYIRADEIDVAQTLSGFLASDPALFAVYHAPARFWPPGEYVALLSVNHPSLGYVGRGLVIAGGHLVGLDYGCGQTPLQIVESDKLSDVVVAPSGAIPTP
ncbi:MAG: hypothetical protein ABR978_01750 [Dehalococcoidia bacterium]|jgi:hypothetical protein